MILLFQSWSPDGKTIYFLSERRGFLNVRVHAVPTYFLGGAVPGILRTEHPPL
ncbi:PD40 domain-containing protein [Alloacidobacterium dinghuense]|uniref:PD40 domain-containing protein n=1 Tax=Alloacidobacterium dinghuense TaxID=2763107 RepID=A0A7G8BF28_9BACT|nr:PD40 domain-containing protein [Alloacidobacterium dinghuense]